MYFLKLFKHVSFIITNIGCYREAAITRNVGSAEWEIASRTNLSKEEEKELKNILSKYSAWVKWIISSDFALEFIADVERCKWSQETTKRKVVIEPVSVWLLSLVSFIQGYHNKYGADYKRKESPFVVRGMNECFRALSQQNLRLLIINISAKFCFSIPFILFRTLNLISNFLFVCWQQQVPIIPLKHSPRELSRYFNDSRGLTSRVICIGITRVTPLAW